MADTVRAVETINRVIEEITQITNTIASAVTKAVGNNGRNINFYTGKLPKEVNLISNEIKCGRQIKGAAQNAGKPLKVCRK